MENEEKQEFFILTILVLCGILISAIIEFVFLIEGVFVVSISLFVIIFGIIFGIGYGIKTLIRIAERLFPIEEEETDNNAS